jgi:hypothetical protein
MELYIRLIDGQPFEHPILGNNFREVFPNVDVNNLPSTFARFVRIQKPTPAVYQVTETQPTYVWIDGVVTDDWGLRDMTAEEKSAKIAEVMQLQPFPSWIFDEPTCEWQPPVAHPTEGFYSWNEETQQWVEVVMPQQS